jgi:hypothetical protein
MKYSIVVEVPCYVVVEADSEEEAEDLALAVFDSRDDPDLEWSEASVVSIEEVVE